MRKTHFGLLALAVVALTIPTGIAVGQSGGTEGGPSEAVQSPTGEVVYATEGNQETVYSSEPISDELADQVSAAAVGEDVGSAITAEDIAQCEEEPQSTFCDLALVAGPDKAEESK